MAGPKTIESGTLLIGSAFPYPPFELERDQTDTGFDAELMRAICGQIGLRWKLVKYRGDDFDRIFDGLRTGDYDTVVSGTAITPEREKVALFSAPYLEAAQSLVVNTTRTPEVTSTDELSDQVVGVQTGHTSDLVARELQAEGKLRDIRYYPRAGLVDALDDLDAGRVGGFITLLPVATWLVKERPDLAVVQELPILERLGIAFGPGNVGLRDAVNRALAECRSNGTLERLERRWLQ